MASEYSGYIFVMTFILMTDDGPHTVVVVLAVLLLLLNMVKFLLVLIVITVELGGYWCCCHGTDHGKQAYHAFRESSMVFSAATDFSG